MLSPALSALCGTSLFFGGAVFESAQPPPAVDVGPELRAAATPLVAPVQHVTVYSDRARVRRRATAKLTPGVHALRFPDLPGILRDTVRVSATGAKVLRAEAESVERERFTIPQVNALLDRVTAIRDELDAAIGKAEAHEHELSLLADLQPAAPVAETERVGQPVPQVAPALWGRILDFTDQRRLARQSALRRIEARIRDLETELSKLEREIQAHNLGAFIDKKLQVTAVLEVQAAGDVGVTLEYFVPGAAWWPTYDLLFDPAAVRLTMRTAGLVRQASGEDWVAADLALSTAIPGQGIDLPELLTWTLGEKKDFEPRARAQRAMAAPPRFAPPAPPRDAERDGERELLQRRIATVLETLQRARAQVAQASVAPARVTGGKHRLRLKTSPKVTLKAQKIEIADRRKMKEAYEQGLINFESEPADDFDFGGEFDFDDDTIEGDLEKPDGAYLESRKVARPPPAPSPSPSYREEALAMPASEGASGGATLGDSFGSLFSSDEPAAPPTVQRSLNLSGEAQPGSTLRLERDLPATLAGGLDFVYDAAQPADIPSTGERVRVPLRSDAFAIETFYEATPALLPTAYLRAIVVNPHEVPLLRGPVNIFVAGDFAGEGVIETTGPGGELRIPLGADEDIRLVRHVSQTTETTGVFSKDDVTTYRVKIEVGNYKKTAVKVRVLDQVPLSGDEEVKIEIRSTQPAKSDGPDADGVLRWDLSVAAGETRTIELVYAITRPEGWELYQH